MSKYMGPYNHTVKTVEDNTTAETYRQWKLRHKRNQMNVTRYQAKVVLNQAGMLGKVQDYVEKSTDPVVKLAWEEAGFQRRSPLIEGIGVAMELSELEIDHLFEQAQKVG